MGIIGRRGAGPLAALLFLLPSSSEPQTTLDSSVLSEQGSLLETGAVELLSSGGQAAIGEDIGYLYTLPLVTMPSAVIDSPAGEGVCSIVNGRVTITGSVESAALRDYRLEALPGPVLISSGATAVSGVLGVWDTHGAAGPRTLRLTANDASGGTMVASVQVHVGQPSAVLTVSGFDKPEGVSADADGRLYVADKGNDRVVVLSSAGASLATLRGLDKPEGAAPGVFVADTGHDRVVKLGLDGGVLLSLGGKKTFDRPEAVAVDAAGSVYVADTKNNRVRVYSGEGTALRTIVLPDKGEPSALAPDGDGGFYVADRKRDRLLRYDPAGALKQTLGQGLLKHPDGVAAGRCVVVSEDRKDRLLSLDRFGNVQAAFAGFKEPAGLALTAAGELVVADRGRDQVIKLAVPGSAPPVVVGPCKGKGKCRAWKRLARHTGGVVEREDKAGVVVPAFALPRDVEITVSSAAVRSDIEERDKKRSMEERGLKGLSEPVEYGPEGTRFDAPVTLVLPYEAALARDYGIPEQLLKVHYWNPETKDWEALDSVVDAVNRTVSAKTGHFSLYQVLAPPPAPSAAPASETFGLREVYAFPNPARPGQRPTIRVQVGLADSVELNVYDLSGRRLAQVHAGSPSTLDDGQGSELTYDFAWDAGGVGSGVYYFAVTAKKAGHPDIRKVGKVAVIK